VEEHLFSELCLLVAGCAVLAWATTRIHQPVLLAYLFCGLLVGPPGLNLIGEVQLLDALSQMGITLLLFLAGMVLHPNRLTSLFKSTMAITLISCGVFWAMLYAAFCLGPLSNIEAAIGASACMLSSTILVIKLLPTTTLHQLHMGSVCIAILIIQDLIAVLLLVLVRGTGSGAWWMQCTLLLLKSGGLIAASILGEQYIIRPMMRQTERYHEVLYILCLGWCLGMAWFASILGLSHEIGAFLAGVAIARSPLSRFLTEELKPLRDFFLMLFFFALGARLDLGILVDNWLPILFVGMMALVIKPPVYYFLFRKTGEQPAFSREISIRLSPASEFGLIITAVAIHAGTLAPANGQIIQSAIILNMILSCWLVVRFTPSPLASAPQLKQD
jgi:Kef-type K+ transport system membrane component KefB